MIKYTAKCTEGGIGGCAYEMEIVATNDRNAIKKFNEMSKGRLAYMLVKTIMKKGRSKKEIFLVDQRERIFTG